MIIIPIQAINGVNHPSQPCPADAVQIVCNGQEYIVYQPGDELPPAPPMPDPATIQPEAA